MDAAALEITQEVALTNVIKALLVAEIRFNSQINFDSYLQ